MTNIYYAVADDNDDIIIRSIGKNKDICKIIVKDLEDKSLRVVKIKIVITN